MKVEFKDTFFESVEKLVWYDTKLWKVWEAIRYDIPGFLKNIYKFRKPLWNHRWYDYHYTLEVLQTSLEIMEEGMHDGKEVIESRGKKITKMQRAIQILKNINDDKYIEMAEAELGALYMRDWEFEDIGNGCSRLLDKYTDGEKLHNGKVFDRSRVLQEQEWKELWKIFEGQDTKAYRKFEKTLTEEQRQKADSYNQWFDGSGLLSWWD
jgi:DNA-binding ferritin-like protein (Dps family)